MKLALAMILAAWLSVPQFAASDEQAAQQAVAAQRFVEARELYRQLAKQHPNNLAYQNWVARLSSWLKDYELALDLFDETLARDQQNLEAIYGKAYVRMWRKEFDAAELLLDQAEQIGGKSLAWQSAKFSFHVLQRQARAAREHLAAMRQLDPHNASLSDFEQQLAGLAPFTVEIGYEAQSLQPLLPTAPLWRSKSLNLTWRGERNTLGARLERDELNATQQVRTGLSFSHRFGDRWWLRGSALVGSSDAQALLKNDLSLGGAVRLAGRWTQRFVLSGDYRRIRFAQTLVHVVSPTIEFNQSATARWQVTAFRNWQRAAAETEPSLALLVRHERQLAKPLRASLSWSQVPGFPQWGWSAALSYQLQTRVTLNAHYGKWFRNGSTQQNTFGLSLAVR